MAEMTYREALNLALREEMERDPRVWVLGEDVGFVEGTYKVTKGLLAEFGEMRVLDTPIAEAGIVGMAIGSALAGLRPVAEMMTWNFSLVAMDQIINHMAKIPYMFGGKLHLPMVIRGPQGGRSRKGAQHSQSLESFFVHTPGLLVVAPYFPRDAKGLLKSAIRDENPVIFLEHEQLYSLKGEVPLDPEFLVPLGKGEVVREGKDLTLISYSYCLGLCLKASETLAKEGVEVEVVDLKTLKPLDLEVIFQSVRKTHRAIVVHEAWKTLGLGAEICALIQEHCLDDLDAPVKRVAGEDLPAPYSPPLEDLVFPQESTIVEAVFNLLEEGV